MVGTLDRAPAQGNGGNNFNSPGARTAVEGGDDWDAALRRLTGEKSLPYVVRAAGESAMTLVNGVQAAGHAAVYRAMHRPH